MERYKLREIKDLEKFIDDIEKRGYRFGNAYSDITLFYDGNGKTVGTVEYSHKGRKYYQWCALMNS